MMRHFRRHFIAAIADELLGVHFDVSNQTKVVLVKVKVNLAWKRGLGKIKSFSRTIFFQKHGK